MVILDYDLLKDNGYFFKPMISSKTMTSMCTETLKKVFSSAKKFILLIIINNYKEVCAISAFLKTQLSK